jgi:transposase InsO family protein
MREARLLAPSRAVRVLGPRNHDGTIIPANPNEMWGTDATATHTLEDGQVTVFVVVDHATHEGLGIHAAKIGNRFEALEPLRQAIRMAYGEFREDVALGLKLRHDHGSQFMSDDYQSELRFLGITSSPAFVRAPEGNGCAERFIRTLKEQLLWVRTFRTVEELR